MLTPMNLDQLIRTAQHKEPLEALKAVGALRKVIERLEELHVERARAALISWEEIAIQLGVTKQTVHRKHAPRIKNRRMG